MRFSAATVIAFIGMSHALPAYGSDHTPLPASTTSCDGSKVSTVTTAVSFQGSQHTQPTPPVYGSQEDETKATESSTVSVAGPNYSSETNVPDSSIHHSTPTPLQPSGGLNYGFDGDLNLGEGLDLGGLIGGLLNGGKVPGLGVGTNGGLNLPGLLGGLAGLLDVNGHIDGSGHLDLGGLLDNLKGTLGRLPGGAQLGAFCDQLKAALSGSGQIDLEGLVAGLESFLSGSGKIDLRVTLGIDVSGLIDGLTLLLDASLNGSGGLNIGAMLDQFEAFLSESGHLDLNDGLGLNLSAVVAQLKALLTASESATLDINGVMVALRGFLSGSFDLDGFVSACTKLLGGDLLVSLIGQLKAILKELGIDLNAIAGQLIGVVGGLVKGAVDVSGTLLANGSLDLDGLLSVFGQLGGGVTIGSSVGGSIGGSVGGSVGGTLDNPLGGAIVSSITPGGSVGGSSKVGGGLNLGSWLNGMFRGSH